MQRNFRIIAIGVTVLASIGAGSWIMQSGARPSWNLPVLGGGTMSLDGLRGHVVIASFGATWCPPCRAELPALQALADQYQGRNVKVLWISTDVESVSDQTLTSFVNKLGVRLPVLRDRDSSAYDQFGQVTLPILVVIDKQGQLVGKPHVGFSDKETFLQKMTQIINPLL
jgi:peroxiredoxin